jgi:ribokinase
VNRIAVVGSTMIDLIAYINRVPVAGETVVGERFSMGFGGKGANQAIMARLLGAEVSMVNCLGDDPYGEMTRHNFESFGVDITHVRTAAGASGVAPIWVEPDGTNRIIIVPGANHALTVDQATTAVRSLPDVAVVIGQFEIPQAVTTAAFEAARKRGATTILNPAPAQPLDPRLATVTDWLIPNEVEFATLAAAPPDDPELVAFATRAGVRLVVTLGAAGAALVDDDGTVTRILVDPVEAVDSTGAGDAFVGAFAYALSHGLDPSSAVRLANRCASDSVTRPGTQSSFPSPERCARFLTKILP